jgi:hypothetical protein
MPQSKNAFLLGQMMLWINHSTRTGIGGEQVSLELNESAGGQRDAYTVGSWNTYQTLVI